MDWKEIFQCFVEGQVKSDGKTKPVGSFDRGTAQFLTFETASGKSIFGGILKPDVVDISFDDPDMSDAFMKLRDANGWQCVVLTNSQNGHIHTYWKNTMHRVAKNSYTNTATACGMVADIHGGSTYIRLREPSHDRFPPLFCPKEDMDEVPDELLPIKTSKALWGLQEGGGRNAEMYSYINVLVSQLHLSADQCRHVLRNTNNYVFAEPLPEDEIATILRDESFEKPLAAIDGEKSKLELQESFMHFLDSLGMTIRYNELLNIVEYINIPQTGGYTDIKDTQNVMPIKLKFDFDRYLGKRITRQTVTDLILLEADTHTYNPVQQFIQSTVWDETDRFPYLFEILGVTDPLQRSLIRKWFYQTAALPFNALEAPIQPEGVLVLQGAEGIGKTRFFQQLAFNPLWFSSLDREFNTNNKDILLQMLSVWIAEIGEIDRTFKANKSDNKSFITKTQDEIRKPYRSEQVTKARTTSFCGTTNKAMFLTADSGSRRWWIIPVSKNIVMNDFVQEENLRQFWAQCYQTYLSNNLCFRLTDDEKRQLDSRNRENMEPLPGEEELRNRFDFDAPKDKWQWVTVTALKDLAEYHVANYGTRQIGQALASISQDVPAIQKKHTKRGSEWFIPPTTGTVNRCGQSC